MSSGAGLEAEFSVHEKKVDMGIDDKGFSYVDALDLKTERQALTILIKQSHDELVTQLEGKFSDFREELLLAISKLQAGPQQQQQTPCASQKHGLLTTSADIILPMPQPDQNQAVQLDLNDDVQPHLTQKEGDPTTNLGTKATNAKSADNAVNPNECVQPHPIHEEVSQFSSGFSKRQSFASWGVFADHPELYAFLQVKNWDSDFAQMNLSHSFASSNASDFLRQKFTETINSTAFDMGVGAMIVANSIVMGLDLEYEGMRSAQILGLKPDEGNWPNAHEAFHALEHVFAIFFLVELILRISAAGRMYFKQALNWMDFSIVFISILEMYIFPLVSKAEFPNVTFLRLLRIFKLVRVLRIVRVLECFENLRILLHSVVHSFRSLLWSVLLLGVIQLIASIFITQSLQPYLQDDQADPLDRAQVYEFFGSWSRSCITLFEMTLAIGTWGRCGRVVIFKVDRYYALFFFGYLAVVSFGMMRVIAALFLKDTLSSAAKDNEAVTALVNRDPNYIQKIRNVFKQMDADGDGVLQVMEIDEMLRNDSVCDSLKTLGVVPRELKGLLHLMDDGDNEISVGEFISMIMRIKDKGKGVDLPTLLLENRKLTSRILAVSSQVDTLTGNLAQYKLAYDISASTYPTSHGSAANQQHASHGSSANKQHTIELHNPAQRAPPTFEEASFSTTATPTPLSEDPDAEFGLGSDSPRLSKLMAPFQNRV